MQLNSRNLKSIIDNEALAYAMYTVENRAIPNMIDGFKPVQRFVVHRALDLARGNKEKFHKLASIAGGVADLGYHHGESSAQDAGALMANTWNNNYPLLDGQGNFGSRTVQKAAASRYIFARVSKNFYNVYKDTEYAPAHEDKEHIPPKFYLPIIPTVLLNGVSGIATGYATNILPHSFKSVKKAVLQALQGKNVTKPKVEFPEFRGEVHEVDGRYEIHGTYKFTSRTQMQITEIPYKFDRETYVSKVLDPLEDKGLISWEDDCGEHGFGFKVKFRKEYSLPDDEELRHEKIMKDFSLIERRSQNITVINEKGKLAVYDNVVDLIKDFVEVRKTYVQKRIDNKILESEKAFKLAFAKAHFIKKVISGEIVIQGKTRKALTEELAQIKMYKEHVDKLVGLNIFHITSDEARKLAEEAKAKKEENEYWKSTDVVTEYTKDLEAL
ncbi:topoisomerase II subunit [Escherichia phage vB_EcoM_PhAPEC2]|uniref:DNA topoisomerase (ATP-hydrolyzing) n=1 Tax=Escherichia phage vB_EcoM_PhAPEC2 TaxID=1391224 RepID=A0A067ZK49_9CAUD|nr:DNA topoisomerase II [Escherichia phage vB_EcoM_PhAPEC2]AHV82956.1 topoisomerase II subunit [Escherichia phage vB_EcoM_PhAPEC2]